MKFLFKKKNKTKSDELPYGWSGNYPSWKHVEDITQGYHQSNIAEKVLDATLKVKKGEAVYERDSFTFDHSEYSWPLLYTLLRVASENEGNLEVVDLGGALGSLYFQHRDLLKHLNSINWKIIEQKTFVGLGNLHLKSSELNFFDKLSECSNSARGSVLIASSVLQYLPNTQEMIGDILQQDFEYIIIDRTAFIEGDDRITLQRVPPHIYDASYPSWFFNFPKFIDNFLPRYDLLAEFDNGIEPPIDLDGSRAFWKGLILKRKS